MTAIIKVLISAAAVWVAVQIVPGLSFNGSTLALLGIALVLGVVNLIVKPLLTVLSLPFIVVTMGLFLLVVNAIAFAIVIAISRALDLGLDSDGFGWTFLGALVVSLVTWGLETLTRTRA